MTLTATATRTCVTVRPTLFSFSVLEQYVSYVHHVAGTLIVRFVLDAGTTHMVLHVLLLVAYPFHNSALIDVLSDKAKVISA